MSIEELVITMIEDRQKNDNSNLKEKLKKYLKDLEEEYKLVKYKYGTSIYGVTEYLPFSGVNVCISCEELQEYFTKTFLRIEKIKKILKESN